MSERPIFVCGFQRSGTTLLQALLGAHPRIAAPPETYFIFRVVRLARTYGDLADDANLRRAIHDALNPPLDLFAECGFDEERVFARAAASEVRTMRTVFDAMMDDFTERRGKSRWSDKSPGQRADDVFNLYEDAQVIHIVRDPRDVIASSLATPWTTEDAASLALEWRDYTLRNARAGLQAGPERFVQIRYEDLTRDPRTTMQLLCTFLNESFDDAMVSDTDRRRDTVTTAARPWQLHALEPVRSAVEGSWRSRMSRRDAAIVNAILSEQIRTLGYEGVSQRTLRVGRLLATPAKLKRTMRTRRMRRLARDPDRVAEEIRRFLAGQRELMTTQR
jgi:LPS sulfotransferase NodH